METKFKVGDRVISKSQKGIVVKIIENEIPVLAVKHDSDNSIYGYISDKIELELTDDTMKAREAE